MISHLSLRSAQAQQLVEATRGEFEVIQQLGAGAMGAVYLARDVALGRNVAIKVIAPNLLADETMVSRFRLEAQTVAALRHPHIVTIHAVRQSEDLHFFVMQLIDGPTLRSIVAEHAPMDVDVVRALLFQIGSALAHAHRSGGGVIHRDVKPANIMVDRDGDAFITDFGISKIAEAQTGLTQTGATIGTPEYMSPEQCRGGPLTGASDQYALGVVAYEMLCGRTPFTGTLYDVMVAHTSRAPAPLLEARPDCPPDVARAVERMLAKAPADRWPDLDAAVAAMGGAPLGYNDPVRRKIQALTGATLLVAPPVGAAATSGALSRPGTPRPAPASAREIAGGSASRRPASPGARPWYRRPGAVAVALVAAAGLSAVALSGTLLDGLPGEDPPALPAAASGETAALPSGGTATAQPPQGPSSAREPDAPEPNAAAAPASDGGGPPADDGTGAGIANDRPADEPRGAASEPAPPPAPVAETPPALPTRAEARAAVAAWVEAVQRGDADFVARRWEGTDGQRDELLGQMRERELSASLEAVTEPVLRDGIVGVGFQVRLGWRTGLGQSRSRDLRFLGRLERVEDGWRLVAARPQVSGPGRGQGPDRLR
ncbi:MAG TPA: protein kinase [Longimicrobiales bacterium]|nr:protein kinase [Longimicrobiales bacterium]